MAHPSIVFTTPLGSLRLTANDEAITAVCFEDTTVAASTERPEHPLLQQCKLQLEEYFAGSRQAFDLPIQQTGTAFQQKVWNELMNIRYGTTTSYLALSKKIGDAKAIRAVGTTNGKNTIAIIVPCHRVIGTNGNLTGYAGGLWRKQWLLEHEGALANGVQRLF